jgi:predicted component of type VI protein secretion system
MGKPLLITGRCILPVAALVVSALSVSACSTVNSALGGNSPKEAQANVKYEADPRGVQLRITSRERLNFQNGAPHALTIAIVQGVDPKGMLALAKNPAELNKLLSGAESSETGILSVDRFVIQPGGADVRVLPRRRDAQVVLVCAGYFNATLAQSVRVLEVPVAVVTSGLITKTHTATPAAMNITLTLAETMIEDFSLIKGDEQLSYPSGENPALRGSRPDTDPRSLKVRPI